MDPRDPGGPRPVRGLLLLGEEVAVRGAKKNSRTPQWRRKNQKRGTRYRDYDRYWSNDERVARQARQKGDDGAPDSQAGGSGGPERGHPPGENQGVPPVAGEAER